MFDGKALGEQVVQTVRDFVSRSLGPLSRQISELEDRIKAIPAPEKGDRGERGDAGKEGLSAYEVAVSRGFSGSQADWLDSLRGKSAEPVDVELVIAEVVAKIPAPKDGSDGRDGKDAEPVDTKRIVAEVVGLIPKPNDGRDGKDADEASIVAKVLESIPVPKDGNPGRDGIDGKDGRDGIDGERGEKGDVGEKGDPGESIKGDPGRDGTDGKDGASVSVDDVLPIIERAVASEVSKIPAPKDGRDGRDAKDGRDGADGRDAASIEPLPSIDEAKSYPRGTWAKHNGGLWLSRSSTEGMTGWDCIVDGIAGSEIKQEEGDPRNVLVKLSLSSGKSAVELVHIPMLIDRGIFKADESYRQGDVTTWDGSMWIAQKATSDKPGTSDSWRLSVKRGRDGRDGLRGEKGDRGSEGRAGRDLTQLGPDGSKH